MFQVKCPKCNSRMLANKFYKTFKEFEVIYDCVYCGYGVIIRVSEGLIVSYQRILKYRNRKGLVV